VKALLVLAPDPEFTNLHVDATATVGAVDVLARLDELQRTQNTTQAIINENQAMLQETRVMLQETWAMVMNIRLASQNAKVPQERNHYKPLQKTVSQSAVISVPIS
jgi:hypothetical protein